MTPRVRSGTQVAWLHPTCVMLVVFTKAGLQWVHTGICLQKAYVRWPSRLFFFYNKRVPHGAGRRQLRDTCSCASLHGCSDALWTSERGGRQQEGSMICSLSVSELAVKEQQRCARLVVAPTAYLCVSGKLRTWGWRLIIGLQLGWAWHF